MDPAERLADYLAGELDADERAAVEADLAREPTLRARLDAMRRADTALGRLEPVTPPAGYEARLRAAVHAALQEELAAAAGETAERDTTASDELAARRARRTPRWVPALAGAAAGIAVLAGVALLVRGGPFEVADEADPAMEMEVAEADAPEDLDAEEPADIVDGPTVVVSDRELDEDSADALLAAGELAEVAGRDLDPATGASVSARWWAALQPALDDAADLFDDQAAAEPDEEVAPPVAPEVFGERALARSERDDIGRCLDELVVDDAAPPIPVYVEVASFEGEPALVFGFVAPEPPVDRYGRTEIWVVAREDCQVLRFAQD